MCSSKSGFSINTKTALSLGSSTNAVSIEIVGEYPREYSKREREREKDLMASSISFKAKTARWTTRVGRIRRFLNILRPLSFNNNLDSFRTFFIYLKVLQFSSTDKATFLSLASQSNALIGENPLIGHVCCVCWMKTHTAISALIPARIVVVHDWPRFWKFLMAPNSIKQTAVSDTPAWSFTVLSTRQGGVPLQIQFDWCAPIENDLKRTQRPAAHRFTCLCINCLHTNFSAPPIIDFFSTIKFDSFGDYIIARRISSHTIKPISIILYTDQNRFFLFDSCHLFLWFR